MDVLKRLTCSLAYGWYLVVATVLTPSSLQSAAEHVNGNLGLLSVSTADSISSLAIQCSMKILAIMVAVAFVVFFALAS